jgi:GNAT superfamily N-acetyltransferase
MADLRFETIENGAVARRGRDEVARVTGRLGEGVFGRHAWIDWTLADGEDAGVLADLYAIAGDPWVRDGRMPHYVDVPADRDDVIETWFGLCFGRQQVYAARRTAGGEPYEGPVRVRIGGPDDVDVAEEHGDLIFRRHGDAPVWASGLYDTTHDEWVEFLGEERSTYFVAEIRDRAVAHLLLYDKVETPRDETYLAIAATVPEARGAGAMRALTSAALAWAAQNGYVTCATDWRSTNIESSRFWTSRGFAPTSYRLHRLVGH